MRHLKKFVTCFSMGKKPFKSRGIFCGINHSKMMVILFVFENFVGSNYKPKSTKCRVWCRSWFLPIRQKVIWFLTLEFGHFFVEDFIFREMMTLEFWIQGWYFILDLFYPLEIRLKWRNARDAFSDTHITHTFQQATKSFLGDKNLPTKLLR